MKLVRLIQNINLLNCGWFNNVLSKTSCTEALHIGQAIAYASCAGSLRVFYGREYARQLPGIRGDSTLNRDRNWTRQMETSKVRDLAYGKVFYIRSVRILRQPATQPSGRWYLRR